MTEAERQALLNHVSFKEIFRFHYVIAPENLNLPGMSVVELAGAVVHIGESLFETKLYDKNGEEFGMLLGVASDHDGNDPLEKLVEIFDSHAPDAIDILEDYLVQVAGRYAFIVQFNGELRIYVDPVGMIGALYNAETKRFASSTLLTIDRPVEPSPYYDLDDIRAGKGGYGINHTADAACFRMNPNHYFDYHNFESHRFWPKADDSFSAKRTEYGENIDEIIRASRNVITSIANRYISAFPLSGGNDSRILFAVAGEEGRAEIDQFYTHINNFANRRDAAIASLICSLGDVEHEIHDRRHVKFGENSKRRAEKMWRIGSGTNLPAPLEVQNGLLEMVRDGSVVMRGHQTNIMRGQYLNFRDPIASNNVWWVLKMMRLAMDKSQWRESNVYFRDQVKNLRDDLPKCTEDVQAEFLFLEALVPAALGPLFQGTNRVFYMSPFNSRRLVQLSMQFSLPYKLKNNATNDVIMRAYPELMLLPLANALPASFEEGAKELDVRAAVIESTRARYFQSFGERAPEILLTPFDVEPYEKNLEKMRKKLGLEKS